MPLTIADRLRKYGLRFRGCAPGSAHVPSTSDNDLANVHPIRAESRNPPQRVLLDNRLLPQPGCFEGLLVIPEELVQTTAPPVVAMREKQEHRFHANAEVRAPALDRAVPTGGRARTRDTALSDVAGERRAGAQGCEELNRGDVEAWFVLFDDDAVRR